MSRRRTARILHRTAAALFWTAAAVALVLWQCSRALPDFAIRWLERRLSAGALSCRFEGASLNVFKGVTLRNTRVHVKRTLGPPLAQVEELRLDWDVDASRPVYAWARAIHAKGLVVPPILEIPGMDGGPSLDLAALFRTLSVEHDWFVAPREVVLEDARVFDVACKYATFGLSLRGGVLFLDGIRLSPDAFGYSETLEGELRFDPDPVDGGLRTALRGTLTPDVIRALTLFLEGDIAVEYYDAVTDIESPLDVSGEVLWTPGEGAGDVSDMRLTISGGGFAYRGRPVRRFKMGLQWLSDPGFAGETGERLVISPLDAVFPDGTFSGALAWYPRTHAIDVKAESTLSLLPLFTILDLPRPSCLTNFVFSAPPRTDVSGRLFPDEAFGPSTLTGHVKAERLRLYGVDLDNASTTFGVSEYEAATFRDISATCYGGAVTGRVDLAFPPEGDDAIDLDVAFHAVHTDPLRVRFDPEAQPSKGRLAGRVQLAGPLDSAKLDALHGAAKLSARDAAITRVPLFAGLTDFIGRNVVGVDLLVMQSDSDLRLSLTNGLATVERLTVDGNMLSIVAKGKCRVDAPDLPVEGVAQVRFFHSRSLAGFLARLVTLPVSKLMEFRIYGPLSKPTWDYIGLIDRLAEATFWPRGDATSVTDKEMEKE